MLTRLLCSALPHGHCPPKRGNLFFHNSSRRRSGASRLALSTSNAAVTTPTNDLLKSLPSQYLRSLDLNNYDPATHQLNNVKIDQATGKKLLSSSVARSAELVNVERDSSNNAGVLIAWDDGLVTRHTDLDLERAVEKSKGYSCNSGRILWSDLTEQELRNSDSLSVPFSEVLTDEGMSRAVTTIYEYGILMVNDTPVDDGGVGIAALGAALGGGKEKSSAQNSILANYLAGGSEVVLPDATDGPLKTLYGSVWATASSGQPDGTSVADSAYGNDGLPLHTDMTYHRDPPGLQIFTMVQPAIKGGESVVCDGFSIAEALRSTEPDLFDVLSRTVRRYRSIDEATGWHLEASGPVIQLGPCGSPTMIRHNDLDRLPDLPPPSTDADEFYRDLSDAHVALDKMLSDDMYRLVLSLNPGDTIVVANQRCLHGRHGFDSDEFVPRTVMGCYVGQDELNSRFRLEGHDAV